MSYSTYRFLQCINISVTRITLYYILGNFKLTEYFGNLITIYYDKLIILIGLCNMVIVIAINGNMSE